MLETQLTQFFSGLQATHKTAHDIRKIYDRELALEFNPLLAFFPVKENKFSQILAYFLNPDAAHGQGDVFLKIFLKRFGFAENEKLHGFERVEVVCERATHEGRRLDIYLRFLPNNFGLGIENKIWAGGQREQLTHYNAYLAAEHGDNYCLVYWRPYDFQPEEHSITAEERTALESTGHYRAFNHMDNTSDLVEECIAACRAEKVRTFLKDLHQNIQHEINGEKFMGQNELTADFVMKNEENFHSAIQVSQAMNTVYDRVMDKLQTDLKQVASELGLVLEVFDMLPRWEKDTHFSFSMLEKSTLPVNISFEWEGNYYKSGYVGFVNRDGDHLVRAEQFAARLGKASFTKAWPWYKSWDAYKNFSEATYEDVFSGKFARSVKATIQELLTRIEGFELVR